MCASVFVHLLYRVHWAHVQVLAKPVHLLPLAVSEGVANITCLCLLAPPFGALGAALSDGAVGLLQLVASSVVLRKTMRLVYDYHALLLASVASAVAGLVLWLGHSLWQAHAVMALPLLGVAGLIYVLSLARRLKASDVAVLLAGLPRGLRDSRFGQAMTFGAHWLLVRV
jgi:peptidoglycan biosynthesis protein MviN/MurJ (putative lipid II flippase)